MSLRRPKWKQVERFFLRRGFDIRSVGGDRILVAPPGWNPGRKRQTVRIGHRFTKVGAELPWGHIRQIERAFGVTREELLEG